MTTDSIERFIEDQAFSPVAPPPPLLPPIPSVGSTGDTQEE